MDDEGGSERARHVNGAEGPLKVCLVLPVFVKGNVSSELARQWRLQ